jgi:hypothetical protein
MARVTMVVAVVASLTIVAPAARAAVGCQVPKHAHVRATSRHVVAYTVASGGGTRTLHACLDSDGRRMKVERLSAGDESGTRLGPVAAAGSKLAYAVVGFAPNSGYASVLVLDLRERGGPRRVWSIDSQPSPPTVGRLVLARDGALALTYRWFWRNSFGDYVGPTHEVRAVDAVDDLGPRALDTGTGNRVRLGSLERHGRVITWLNAGERRSARLRSAGRCEIPEEARVRGHTSRVVVYSVGDDSAELRLYGCLARTGATRLMHRASETGKSERSGKVRIVGAFVAWSDNVEEADWSQTRYVRSFDLDRDRLVHEERVGGRPASRCLDETGAPALVLSDTSDVAWTTRSWDGEGCGGPTTEHRLVTAVDPCGRRVLEDDPAIDLRSLRLTRRTLTWTVAGSERSAQLRSAADC